MGQKTKIDWCDSSWNPVTGCRHDCAYCYARGIARRFGGKHTENGELHVLDLPMHRTEEMGDGMQRVGPINPYPFGFEPTLHRYALKKPQGWKKPRSIFVCSMADLFGEWVPDEWIDEVIRSTQKARQHRYLFLTKNPERYDEWLERFEESRIQGLDEIQNCWFGASASNNEQLERANRTRAMWLSIEPIRERIETDEDQFMEFIQTPSGEVERPRWSWVVIGAETGNSRDKVRPEKEWIDAIVEECDFYGTPVFMKESLREIMGADFRQEYPWATEQAKNCGLCKWLSDDYTMVCCNGDSPHRGDFVSGTDSCQHWEKQDGPRQEID